MVIEEKHIISYNIPDFRLNEQNSQEWVVKFVLINNIEDIDKLKHNIESINICLIRSALVYDYSQLLLASQKALHSFLTEKILTKSLNTEVLYNLSISNKITSSFSTFGIQTNDTSCIALNISQKNVSENNPFTLIKGKSIPFDNINKFYDEDLIKEVYELPNFHLTKDGKINLILTKMAIKGKI